MRSARRISALLLASLACTSVADAYYHFIRFALVNGQRRALVEKFDLNVLPNKTLSYFIGDTSALQFAPSDGAAGLVSQIRAAAQAWNDVETSDLRLAFGGFLTPGTVQAAPTLEVLFDEMPPGVIAMGGPTVRAESNGVFIPILKSVVRLPQDLTRRKSYSEEYYGTLVHEMGHALGLQHTLTSSVMSTAVTRATSKAKPLTADDVAGISLLYPARTFLSTTGTISGRVVLQGGQGMNLASVVAISPAGAAISTLTNPDGTYRIDGLPARNYFVYVHPLPPPIQSQTTFADIVYPIDSDGDELGPGVAFDTVFYRAPNVGTNDPDLAASLSVSAGNPVENVNFLVRPRNQVNIHSVQTFAYPNGFGVQPAYLSATTAQPFLVARGEGLVSGNGAVSGLRVRVLSGPTLSVQPFSTPQGTNLQLYFDPRTLAFSTDTPRHLVFSTNNDIYVLPSGFFHVAKRPPTVAGIMPALANGTRLATVGGENLSEESTIMFDGVPGKVQSVDSFGVLTVAPPPAPVGHRANVAALNPDGQSSFFMQSEPPVYTYAPDGSGGTPTFVATPASLPAGAEAMVEIAAVNTNFVDGKTAVGFGNSDIVATRVWVMSATRLLVNVKVSALAQSGATTMTIASGLQMMTQPSSFQVLPFNPRALWLNSTVRDKATQQPSVTAGSTAIIKVENAPFPISLGASTVALGERTVPISGINENEITVQIPTGTPVGPLIVRLDSNGERGLPIVVAIDPPPPRIVSATASNQAIDSARPARAGQAMSLLVEDLDTPNSSVNPARVSVNIGGVFVNVASLTEADGAHRLTLVLPSHSPVGEEVPVSVEIDERSSDTINVPIEE